MIKRRLQRGVVKIENLSHESGFSSSIMLDKCNAEFFVQLSADVWVRDADLATVRRKAKEWLDANSNAKMEPVIVLNSSLDWTRRDSPSRDCKIDLRYDRCFRAKRADGTFLWKSWETPIGRAIPPGENMTWDDVLEIGRPGGQIWGLDNQVVIPYSEAAWRALRQLSRVIADLSWQIRKGIGSGAEKFLTALSDAKELHRLFGE